MSSIWWPVCQSMAGPPCVELTTPYPLPTQHSWIQRITPNKAHWPAKLECHFFSYSGSQNPIWGAPILYLWWESDRLGLQISEDELGAVGEARRDTMLSSILVSLPLFLFTEPMGGTIRLMCALPWKLIILMMKNKTWGKNCILLESFEYFKRLSTLHLLNASQKEFQTVREVRSVRMESHTKQICFQFKHSERRKDGAPFRSSFQI